MSVEPTLRTGVEVLAFGLLLLSIGISLSRTIRQMIMNYVFQSIVLFLITLLTAFDHKPAWFLFLIVPSLLAWLVEEMLAQATVVLPGNQSLSWVKRFQILFRRDSRYVSVRTARTFWPNQPSGLTQLVVGLVLIVVAFGFTYYLLSPESSRKLNIAPDMLAIAFSLLLLGLFMMVSKKDMIAQTIGLLVMEQGMALAAICCVTDNIVALAIVIGLILYIFITLTILVFLLPELHLISASVELDHQRELKG
jgi:hydrogenase-4 membrane subunit HyfE